MSGPLTREQQAALAGAAVGLAAAGTAVGVAAERYAVRRWLRVPGPPPEVPLGSLRGEQQTVRADDGVPLHVEVDEADTDAPTVLFSHGYALNLDSFHFQRLALRGTARLVFWDQRGHGRSGHGRVGRDHIDQLGRDLLRVLEATVPRGPVVLVGHSMGGMTVMALAQAHPELFGERVVGVGLLSTSPGRLAEVSLGVPAAAARFLRRLAPPVVSTLARQPRLVGLGRRLGSDLEFLLVKHWSFASHVPAPVVEFTAGMIDATPLEVVAELFPAFDAHDKLDALGVLDPVPTLVLGGDGDLVTPVEHSRDIATRLPRAELVVVPRAGHMVILEHPDTVNAHLLRLLERGARAAVAA